MTNRIQVLSFLAGVEAFHAVVHAYLSVTKADVPHPVERVGMKATPKFHAVSAIVNGAIAVSLAAHAWSARRALRAAA